METLNELRKKVNEIDRGIIKLIGKRIKITKKIGEKKKEEGIPLRSWEVEKTVIEKATELAAELEISPALIKSLMQQLIMESRVQQEILYYSTYKGDEKNILIVGGLGEMGKWFSHFFQNQGHNVSIYDIKGESENFKSYRSLEEGIDETSFTLIATSLEVVPEIIEKITELKFKGVAFDIASLKRHLKDSIKRAIDKGISITSIHPMFGPNTRTLSDKVICFCDCGDKEADQKVKFLFKGTAASTVKLSLEEHDRVISFVIGLSHIINIIFMKVLTEGGYQYDELKKIASTTFLSQMVTATSVIKENPHLYYAIQKLNPLNRDLYENLKEATKSITEIVLSANKSEFIEIMEKSKHWLKG